MQWVAKYATDDPVTVLDLGGRDTNGSPRGLFPNAAAYLVLDAVDGPDVDVVADAATWTPDREYDVVVACELFEHTRAWPEICLTAHEALTPGGMFVVTTAKPPHGAWGAPSPEPGEWYENVDPERLRVVLHQAGFADVVIDERPWPADVRAVAVRP